jgi:hypothetical protein
MIGARFALNVSQAQKYFLTHPMELLGDMDRLESHFVPFRDGVSFVARYVHGLRQTYHGVKKCFGRTQWSSSVTRLD